MKILFAGGGTGGHVSPALAIGEYAKNNIKNTEIAFVGRKDGQENNAIKSRGHKLFEIDISGFKRKISKENVKNIFKLIKSMKEVKKILKDFKPDAVIGTGGYVSYPVLKCAQKMKIPSYIHESNAYPGLVTRLLSGKAKYVFLNHDDAKEHLRKTKNALTVGNPINNEFGKIKKAEARKKLRIDENAKLVVSFGGSGGSLKMNEEILSLMRKLKKENKKISFIHASGKKYYSAFLEKYPDLSAKDSAQRLVDYIENMPTLLAAADLVISRSGAMSCTEIAASGVPSILIPSPNVAANHQYKNAISFEKAGAASIITEKELNERRLYNEISLILDDEERIEKMRKSAFKLYRKNAAKKICDHITM